MQSVPCVSVKDHQPVARRLDGIRRRTSPANEPPFAIAPRMQPFVLSLPEQLLFACPDGKINEAPLQKHRQQDQSQVDKDAAQSEESKPGLPCALSAHINTSWPIQCIPIKDFLSILSEDFIDISIPTDKTNLAAEPGNP
jgi:hypothetical protein